MLLNLLELASNKTLEHDPNTKARLAKLDGKTMVLTIKPINQSLSITPHADGLEFSNIIPDTVDVTLKATIGAMIKISKDGMEDADLQPGELEIAGDPIIGQRFAQVIAGLEIDWNSLLAEHIGDGPAQFVTTAANQAKELTQDSHVHIKNMVSDFLKNDLQVIVDNQEVDEFLDDVDTLRADSERLMNRIKRLNEQLK